MQQDETIKPAKLGAKIGIVFFLALSILLFVAYVVVSQNVKNMLADYTLQLVQSMVEQGVKTVEYELNASQSETAQLANSLAITNRGEDAVNFPKINPRSSIVRMVYVSETITQSSDGRARDIINRADIQEALSGNTALYGPYFNEDNEYVVCYSAPIMQNGKVTGVLSVEKDGYFFCSLIKNIRFIDSGEAYIINADGTDIAVSDQNHIDWVNDRYNAEKILSEKEDPVTRSIFELEQKGLNGEAGVGTYYWNNGLCYLFYAPIPSVKWVLLAGIREEELVAMTQTALYASIIKSPVFSSCILVFLLLTGIVIYWIVSSFRRTAEINKKLNIIANYDPLTGTLNRHSFHTVLDALPNGGYTSLACIYIDANGLHEINNHLGHQAGDNMLKTVVEVLHQSFLPKDVYRIGGDEFVVFCHNLNEQVVYHKTELVRKDLKKQGYEISIGIEWRDSHINIKSMVNMAEESMKIDKEQYYLEHGKERQIRMLDRELEKMMLQKQDADTFLSILSPEFKGVYFVDMGSDTTRHLYIPPYFEEMLTEAGDVFSKALTLYAKRIVSDEFCEKFLKFIDFNTVEKLLQADKTPEFIYQKKDGSWLKMRILKFKAYTEQSRETLWIFSNVESPL